MFRYASASLRRVPTVYNRQPLLASCKQLKSLSIPRHTFSTTSLVREKVKEQVADKVTKKTDASDVKKLFKLAKPESKSLAGNRKKNLDRAWYKVTDVPFFP